MSYSVYRDPERGESVIGWFREMILPCARTLNLSGNIQGTLVDGTLDLFVPTTAPVAGGDPFWARVIESDDEVHTIIPVEWNGAGFVDKDVDPLSPSYEVNGAENLATGTADDRVVLAWPSEYDGESVWFFDIAIGANGHTQELEVPVDESPAVDEWERFEKNEEDMSVKITVMTRMYVDETEKKIYYFQREIFTDTYGHIRLVGPELSNELASETCEEEEEEEE